MMLDYPYRVGQTVAVREDTPPVARTWPQMSPSVIQPGAIFTVAGMDDAVVRIEHPQWPSSLPTIRKRWVRPHFEVGDRVRFAPGLPPGSRTYEVTFPEDEVFEVTMGVLHRSFGGVQHPFMIGFGARGISDRYVDIYHMCPADGSTAPGPCTCPLDVLMRSGCSCGGR